MQIVSQLYRKTIKPNGHIISILTMSLLSIASNVYIDNPSTSKAAIGHSIFYVVYALLMTISLCLLFAVQKASVKNELIPISKILLDPIYRTSLKLFLQKVEKSIKYDFIFIVSINFWEDVHRLAITFKNLPIERCNESINNIFTKYLKNVKASNFFVSDKRKETILSTVFSVKMFDSAIAEIESRLENEFLETFLKSSDYNIGIELHNWMDELFEFGEELQNRIADYLYERICKTKETSHCISEIDMYGKIFELQLTDCNIYTFIIANNIKDVIL